MRFLILPLLAAINHLDLHRIEWEFGPEVIYNVTVDVDVDQSPTNLDKVKFMDIKYTSQLKCRFGIDEYLKCHFEDSRIYMHHPNSADSSKITSYGSELPDPIDHLPFEIKFDEYGIKELIVPSSIDKSTLKKLKAIVNQLHTGIDFIGKTEGTYEIYEDFTTGLCLTKFNIKLTNLKNNMRKEISEKYKTWSPGMSIQIDKKRNMETCQLYSPYFFNNVKYSHSISPFKINVKSSENKIIADHFKFISSTKTNIDVYKITDPMESVFMNVRESITLIYDSVVPAKKSYPEIDDPVSEIIMI